MFRDFAGAVMFAHDKTWRSRAEQFEHALELGVLVRGIHITEGGFRGLGRGTAKPARNVRTHKAAAVAAVKAFSRLRDQGECLAVTLDEGDRRGSPRQGLEADCAGACVEIDHPGADNA